jgi:hypothetical protein
MKIEKKFPNSFGVKPPSNEQEAVKNLKLIDKNKVGLAEILRKKVCNF